MAEQLSKREKIGAAAVLGYVLLNHSASRLVSHPDDEHQHPVAQVERHEREILTVNEGLKKIADELGTLEKARIERDTMDKASQEEKDRRREAERRSFIQEQQEKRDDRLIDALQKTIQAQSPPSVKQRVIVPRDVD